MIALRWIAPLLVLPLVSCHTTARFIDRSVPPPLDKQPSIRVLIMSTLERFEATSAGGVRVDTVGDRLIPLGKFTVALDDGLVELTFPNGEILSAPEFHLTPLSASTVTISGVPYGVGWWWESREDRSYNAPMHLRPNKNGALDVIIALPVEEYLRGVVPQEIGPTAPAEALKAQAVAARSETIVALRTGKYAGEGFDICADVECQAYSGTGKYSEATDRAVWETYGLVLTHRGEPFGAYYSSNCGGHGEHVENVWPDRSGPTPYWHGYIDGNEPAFRDLSRDQDLRAWIEDSPSVFCNPELNPGLPDWAQKNFRWQVETSATQLTEWVAKRQDIGQVTAIEPLARGESGRLKKVRFVGTRGSVEVGPELAIRQIWNPPLRSAAFVVDPIGEDDTPTTFTLRGAGWGHGVGMCQTGAIGRALRGELFDRILVSYFAEAVIRPWYR